MVPQTLTGNPRHDRLIALVNERGYMNHDELAEILNVSIQTVRRDIRKLSEQGIVVRLHGGVGRSASSVTNMAFEQRETTYVREKTMIARQIADYIPNGSTVFITIGTSVEHVARMLAERQDLRVITNSLRVAWLLYKNASIEVVLPGGTPRPVNGGIIGPDTLSFVEGFQADYLITSVGAVSVDGCLLEFYINEAAVTRAMMAHSRHILLAIDHSKFTSSASVRLGNITPDMTVFTDRALPEPLSQLLQQRQVGVVIATD
ncbi:DeoR/GlpR transcriptional regulator [Enterobacteriaceae bacterium YMB-R22]|jgi:DeoR/GlpR family transcriptional regulator of sugar metabolism|uniref:DeoR/GlpR family DNA-binding transcription regulator n=1 Tax=Tenebrionicola larvae TaxID=2815733 RepID=UPI0020123D82|nr:DeoR/GlpR family DNA-binding transcription regulator [Tenebrionicola larvae]MBV4412824.1 DeoR/GlpR transcriptional regulator [Tenebrionicola larvae]